MPESPILNQGRKQDNKFSSIQKDEGKKKNHS
jgi:hypothetical protein